MSVGGHNTTVPPFVFVAARMVGVPLQTKPISKSARFCESISKSCLLPSTNTFRAGEVQGAQAADRSRGKAGGSTEQDVRGAGEGLALTCNVRSLLLHIRDWSLHVRVGSYM